MERKDFFKIIAGGVATGTLLLYLESCKKNDNSINAPTVDFTLDLTAAANAALLTSGGSLVSNEVIIINSNGNYIVLSDICTHQGCSVGYSSSSSQLKCPCHGAVYKLDGTVVSGPARSSLKQYAVEKNGTILHIHG